MNPTIVYEDESFMVVDKPAGWITNSAITTKGQPVLQDWVAENFQFPISTDKFLRNGIVHRLDKETSGIILVAKTESAFENLQTQFKNREVQKTYVALVHGKVEPETGEISVPVGRLPWRRDRFGILPGGREATTRYKVDEVYETESGTFTLLSLAPKTGRTHQIRIHLKYLGYPIVADEFYAGRKTARNDRKWCPRLFLHAAGIEFAHPVSGKRVSFKTVLPDDLNRSLTVVTGKE